jgi:hypothetical protein
MYAEYSSIEGERENPKLAIIENSETVHARRLVDKWIHELYRNLDTEMYAPPSTSPDSSPTPWAYGSSITTWFHDPVYLKKPPPFFTNHNKVFVPSRLVYTKLCQIKSHFIEVLTSTQTSE